MTTLADKSLLSGGDNKPSMLEKHLYDSWTSRMELYMMNRPHGRMILASVEKGPLVWPSITKDGVTGLRNIKFVTDVKLVKDLHTTNVDQLHAYLQQHERHANEVRLMHARNSDPLALVASHQLTQTTYQSHLHTQQTYQQQQPEFSQPDSSLVVPVFQKGDDPIDAINHMMSFLTAVVTSRYPTTNNQLRTSSNPRQQATIYGKNNCANNSGPRLLSWPISKGNGSDALTEVHNPDNLNYDLFNQSEQIMTSSEQSNDVSQTETDITSDSNIIPYSQYLSETQQETVQNSNSSAQQDVLILSMFEQLSTQVTHCTTVNKALTTELDRYKEEVKDLKEMQNVENSFSGSNEQFAEIVRLKQNLFEQVQEKDCLMKTVSELKNDLKLEENRNIDREIALEKKIKQLDNIIFKRGQSAQTVHMMTKSKICYDHSSKQAIGFEKPFYLKKARESKPKLYDGNTILKMDTIVIPDSDETLMLCEESRSKMLLKEQDPFLKELKRYLTGFDQVVKERTTATAITEGTWGFEHTKACFRDEIIPFIKELKDIFNNFNQYLVEELADVQKVFYQMEQAVEQHRLESKTFEVKSIKFE
ncbi:hypothetical protein Tco_0598981 [Tanacetum coccineum]